MSEDKWIGTTEAARFCGVSRPAFRKWIDKGFVEAYVTPGGTARIPVQSLVKTMQEHKMPVPKELMKLQYTRILVVDDDEGDRNAVVSILEENTSYQIDTAKNGYEACIRIGDIKPDIVVFDPMVSLLNGVEFMKEIRRNPITRSIGVIVVTGYTESPEVGQIMGMKIDGFFSKPVEPLKLKHKVDELTGGTTLKS